MTADVNRFHAHADPRVRNGGDTVSAHRLRVRGMCARLSIALGRTASEQLLHAAFHHDDAEQIVGDIPGPAKRRFPKLAAAYAEAEREVLAEMGLTWVLTDQEQEILDLCDRLDSWQFARSRGADLGDDWRACLRMAEALGPAALAWLAAETGVKA